MRVDAAMCILCGACSGVCPVNVIEVSSTHVNIQEGCTRCGLCAKVCPVGAIGFGDPRSKRVKRFQRRQA
ncbi:MAG: 4Fe-4S binding protein [Candidatus Hodarchaeaceae archaeon]|nr:4Fe-4S binding protein [Candidatus Hodarchaeaceae archaeon]